MSNWITADQIYDALLDDEAFAALPARLAEAYGGRSAMIRWRDENGAMVLGYSGCLTADQLATYASHFADKDPWVAASLRHGAINTATNLEDLVPVREFVRSAFYNDYLRPMGDDTARCLGLMARNVFGEGVVAIQRGLSERGFTEEQIAGVDAITPHLRRLLALRGRLAGLERRVNSLTAMLDRLTQAAMLVTADGRIVEANALAAELLSSGTPIAVRKGKLDGTADGQTILLAIRSACDPTEPSASIVPVGPNGRMVAITPVKTAQGQQLAMLLINADRAPAHGLSQLKATYRLTDAEAAVVKLLSAGRSVTEIAEQRGVSVATVRSQFRAIAGKMDCRRQAEVTALAVRFLNTN